MKKINKIMMYCFVFLTPAILIIWFVWPEVMKSESATGSAFLEWGNLISGIMCALWMITSIYVVVMLLISSNFREQVIKRIVFIKERDEREEMIVSKSARNAFLFNLAFLIFFFVMSIISVQVTKMPPEKAIAGKEHCIYFGLRYSDFFRSPNYIYDSGKDETVLFNYQFPMEDSGILLILIMVNIGSFYIYGRKMRRKK